MVFQQWQRKNYSVFNSLHRVVNIGKICFTYILVMLATPNYAQTDTLTIGKNVDLEEVVVAAKRSPIVYSKLSRIVNTLSGDEIEQLPAENLQEALSFYPGVDVKQRGPQGVQADLSIRGGSFDQNLVMLNGINMNDPQTGHFALNLPVDLSAVSKIEILKGSGSRVFGPNAFSGVLNIVTRPLDTNLVNLELQGGQNGYYKSALATNLTTGKLRTFLALSHSGSNGYIDNTDFNLSSLFLQSQYHLNISTVDFQFGYSNKGFGAQGFYTPEYPNQFEENNMLFSALSLDINTNQLNTNASVYWRRHKDRFELFRESEDWYQREGDYFVRNDNDTAKYAPGVYESWNYYSGHNYHLTDVYGANVNTDFRSLLGKTSIGFDFRSENIWSNVLGNPMEDTLSVGNDSHGAYTKSYTRTIVNSYLEHTVYIDGFVASIGVLGSWSNEFNRKWKWFPGADLSYNFTKALKVFASANRSLRAPTFTDLFYEGPNNIGNPELKNEHVTSYESGLKWNQRHLSAYLSAFYSNADDVIAWVDTDPDDKGKFKTENLTNLTKKGLEFRFQYRFTQLPLIDAASMNYTYIDQTKDAGKYTSKYSLNYLKNKLVINLRMQPLKQVALNISGHYNDRNGSFLRYDKVNDTYLSDKSYAPYWLFNAKLRYDIDSWDFYIQASNLLDNHYYDMGNIRMPGRWIKIGVHKKLHW